MFNLSGSALLTVDVQNDFCSGGTLAVPNGDQVIAPLNIMISLFNRHNRLIIFSRDWHPRNTKHFAEFGGKWPVHCVQGSWGAELNSKLNTTHLTTAIDIIKGTSQEDDGYSPFEGVTLCGVFSTDRLLKSHGVTELFIGGLATEYCVKAASLDAIRFGYKTNLLLDACKAVNINPHDGDRAIEEMIEAGVVITTTRKVFSEIR